MASIRIADVVDEAGFRQIPPCADPGFDHRSCDYWEDADRGSKAARLAWLEPPAAPPPPTIRAAPDNPFLTERPTASAGNPFAPTGGPIWNAFLGGDEDAAPVNPFAPAAAHRPGSAAVDDGSPRKLQLLRRGMSVIGTYAKVLYRDEAAAVYCQFGPLTAYPRAQRTRELYPQLPDAPLPAVITCIATTPDARGEGLALTLIAAVCDDLAGRGFAAIEAYPETGTRPDSTSAGTPGFWEAAGFTRVVDDERFPVMRREL
jgi:ribosomal protein S18 acetylase RimI-like enzyme